MNPPRFIRDRIKSNLIHNTRKAIAIKAKADRKTAWTPELVVSRMHEDTDADVFVLFGLVGIDEAKLLEIAREALESIGIACSKVVVVSSVKYPSKAAASIAEPAKAPAGKKPGIMARVNKLFKRKKK